MKILLILFAVLIPIPQTVSPPMKSDVAIVEFAEKAVVRALDYRSGDRQSLIDAQNDFTQEGWQQFMKRMDGWLDTSGAPLGNSTFTTNGPGAIVKRTEEVLLTVPGTLTQSQGKSVSTYQVEVEIRMDRNTLKIAHLEPVVRLKARARQPN